MFALVNTMVLVFVIGFSEVAFRRWRFLSKYDAIILIDNNFMRKSENIKKNAEKIKQERSLYNKLIHVIPYMQKCFFTFHYTEWSTF